MNDSWLLLISLPQSTLDNILFNQMSQDVKSLHKITSSFCGLFYMQFWFKNNNKKKSSAFSPHNF